MTAGYDGSSAAGGGLEGSADQDQDGGSPPGFCGQLVQVLTHRVAQERRAVDAQLVGPKFQFVIRPSVTAS